MKYIGPAILLMVLVLAYAILFRPDWVWTLGGITVFAVMLGIIATFVADLKGRQGEKE